MNIFLSIWLVKLFYSKRKSIIPSIKNDEDTSDGCTRPLINTIGNFFSLFYELKLLVWSIFKIRKNILINPWLLLIKILHIFNRCYCYHSDFPPLNRINKSFFIKVRHIKQIPFFIDIILLTLKRFYFLVAQIMFELFLNPLFIFRIPRVFCRTDKFIQILFSIWIVDGNVNLWTLIAIACLGKACLGLT
jgi:hypothetical protein